MIVLGLVGGLGNQMFQYAFARIFAAKKKSVLYLDLRFFKLDLSKSHVTVRKFELSIFENNYNIANSALIKKFDKLSYLDKLKRKLKLSYPKKFNESTPKYLVNNFNGVPPVYIKGYFQSYKYYIDNEDFVRSLFVFPLNNLSSIHKSLSIRIKQSNSVSVHIRRGDYVKNEEVSKFHGNLSLDYYNKAIEFICSKVSNPHFFFFSDDISWVEAHYKCLSLPKEFVVNSNHNDSWMDMLLMSNCSHHIIANSSFSWWGAWLNNSTDKIVISPKKWYANAEQNNHTKDLIPPDWIRI